jgi:pyruvate/2-oxoglutarate/acetoin dehydrogenase E1 component
MPTDSGQATYLEAVGLALDSEMDRDPDVFIIGRTSVSSAAPSR